MLELAADEREFLTELRAWLDENAPPEGLRDYGATPTEDELAAAKTWQRQLADGGWSVMSWPRTWGGRGVHPRIEALFIEELAIRGLPRQLNVPGPDIAGPILIAHGNQEQQETYLPRIVTGDDVWCALYSEPEAGSDLSSVRTWAEPDGEGWRVSGQKVWTSGAHYADYGLLLARTSRDGKASQSLSTFVVPMRSPGVTVRPLISMTGDSKFNEVFLEDVRLDAAALIGTVGKGWAQIRVGTGRERMTLGSYAIGMWNDLAEIAEIARVADATPPDGFDSEWARLWMRVWTLRTTWLQMMTEDTPPADPRMSVLKLESSELGQQIAGLALRVTSGDAVAHERWTQRFFESRGATIAGGTSEIQRNVIAERVLGMPR